VVFHFPIYIPEILEISGSAIGIAYTLTVWTKSGWYIYSPSNSYCSTRY